MKALVTGVASAFGALLGALVGSEIAATQATYRPKNVRRSDVTHARTTGAVAGGAVGAFLTGALTGASSVGDPEPKQLKTGVGMPPQVGFP